MNYSPVFGEGCDNLGMSQMPASAESVIPTHGVTRLVLSLVLVVVLCHGAMGAARLTISLYALHLTAGPQTVGILLALLALIPMLLSIKIGRWIDAAGPRRPLLFASVSLAASIAIPNLQPGIPMLFVASIAIGGVFVIIPLAAQSAIGAVASDDNRQRLFSWLALAFSVSTLLGPLAAGYVIDHFGHRVSFVIFAFPPLVAAIVVLLLRELRQARPRRIDQDRSAHRTADLLAEPGLVRVFIAAGLLAMGWDLFGFMLPVYGSSIHLSATQVGTVMAVFAAATMAVRISLAWQKRQLSEWLLLAGALSLAGLSFAAFPWVSTLPPLFVVSALCGLALGSTQPLVMALITTQAPQGRAGEALGLRATVLNASSFVMPIVFGLITDHAGFKPSFALVSLSLLAGGAFAWRTYKINR
jgi:MFS family permease